MKKNRYLINYDGITNNLGGILRNVSEKDGWYLDLFEKGYWVISQMDKKIAVFDDCEAAVFFFMAKTDPIEPLTREQEAEAMEWLEQQLTNNKNA